MFSMGRLKPFVNDHNLYSAYSEFMQYELDRVRNTMEQSIDIDEIRKLQGEARMVRRLMKLRDYVNGDKRNG